MKKYFNCLVSAITTIVMASVAYAQNNNSSPDVYVVGYEKNAQGKQIATLWKNGKAQYLTNGDTDSNANSIFVSGKDIYVAGTYQKNGMNVPALWKNGELQNLSNSPDIYEGVANSVYVSNSDVYVAGSGDGFATLWKNGIPQQLHGKNPRAVNNGSGKAISVFVSSGNVYVLGSDINGNPLLWVNGVVKQPNANQSYLYGNPISLFVNGTNIYFSERSGPVFDSTRAFFWKNFTMSSLSLSPRKRDWGTNSVFVTGNDVYLAGYEIGEYVEDVGPAVATVWKNGKPKSLGSGWGNSVYVSGGNVYVAGREGYGLGFGGYEGYYAVLWKNGVKTVLGNGIANAVFVK